MMLNFGKREPGPVESAQRSVFLPSLLLVIWALLEGAGAWMHAAEASLPVLTNIDQVVVRGRADRPAVLYPVRVRGVITHAKGWLGRWITIQDGTNACAVNAAAITADLRPGQTVEVDGDLAVESHYPHIARARVTVLGEEPIPIPTPAASSTLAAGRHHGVLVKLQASVLDVCRAGGKPVYLLGSDGISFNAFVEEPIAQLPLEQMNATVELQGISWSSVSGGGSKPSRFNLHVAGQSAIIVKSPGSTNIWGKPRSSLRDLQSAPVSDERHVVTGLVTYASPAGILILEDGTEQCFVTFLSPIPTDDRQVQFVPRERHVVRAGDLVEAVGTIRRARAPSPWLEWAEVRVTGRGQLPEPIPVTPAKLLTGEPDCRRVRLRGRVVEYDKYPQGDARVSRLLVQVGDRTVYAVYAGERYVEFGPLPGREVELTGVPVMAEGTAKARGYTFYLSEPTDARVVPPPGVWRDPVTLKIAGIVSVVAVLAGALIFALRRQVAARTAEIETGRERLRQNEQALQHALARQQEISELKTSFVSMVSHEFRAPLGVIVSSVDILRRYFDRLSPEMRQEQLGTILHSSGSLSRLVEDLMLLGEAEAGRLTCQTAPLELERVCRRLVDEVASVKRAVCRIELQCSGDLSGAQGDEGLLRPALANLLSNAVNYSAPGAVVDFTIRRENHDARFVICDRGGISESDQARLFLAFAQASNADGRQGAGLGLVVARRCVELHGGRIEFQSVPGQGTTFSVIIPVFRPKVDSAEPVTPA